MAINYKLVTATSDASSPDTVFTATAVATHVKSIRIANESGGALTYHLAVYDNSATTEVPLTVPATSLPDDDVDLMVEPINLQNGDYIKLYSSGAGVKVALTLAENTDVAGATTSDDLAEGTTNLYLTSAERSKLSGIATGAEVNQNAFSNIAVAGQTTVEADAKTDTLTLVAGTGVTITTDSTTDSVTITNSVTAPNTFGTIAVATQSSVVADSTTDTLTLVAAGGMTITTNATTDTITFDSARLDDDDVTLAGNRTINTDGNDLIIENTTANKLIEIQPDAVITAGLSVRDVNGTTAGAIRLFEATNNGGFALTLAAPAQLTASTTFTLPSADGTSAQVLQTNGSGTLSFASLLTTAATTTAGAILELREGTNNGTNYVRIQAPASLAANTTYTLPTADGTSGQVLSTDGTGTLSWAAAGSGTPAGSSGQIQYNASGSFGAEAALYYDATNNRLSVGGDTSPGATLEVRGAGTTTGVAFNLENSSGTERFKVLDNGRVAITEHSTLPAFGPTLSLTGTKADYYTASITLRHTSFTTSMTHALDSNTCAIFVPNDYTTGGLAGEGTTSNSAGATPFFFAGYHGSASPTSAAVRFQGGKNNGSNARTSIASAEPVFQLNNWTTITLISLGSGGVGIRNSAPTSTTTLTVRGQGTSTNECLRIENSSGTARFTVRDDGGYAFAGGTVGLAQTGYTTFANLVTDRTCDANATTVGELADILGTLIEDLKTKGIISA